MQYSKYKNKYNKEKFSISPDEISMRTDEKKLFAAQRLLIEQELWTNPIEFEDYFKNIEKLRKINHCTSIGDNTFIRIMNEDSKTPSTNKNSNNNNNNNNNNMSINTTITKLTKFPNLNSNEKSNKRFMNAKELVPLQMSKLELYDSLAIQRRTHDILTTLRSKVKQEKKSQVPYPSFENINLNFNNDLPKLKSINDDNKTTSLNSSTIESSKATFSSTLSEYHLNETARLKVTFPSTILTPLPPFNPNRNKALTKGLTTTSTRTTPRTSMASSHSLITIEGSKLKTKGDTDFTFFYDPKQTAPVESNIKKNQKK
jgi:hypothetical protein